MAMRHWTVVVHKFDGPKTLGSVQEDSEELARCAALSKYGITEDEAEEGTMRAGIYPSDDFDVRPN